MDRMKTFFMYALILTGFILVSTLLENGLIYNMYKTIDGKTNGSTYIGGIYTEVDIEEKESKATSVNGYINLKLKNNMNTDINKGYLKVDLFNDRNLLAETDYFEIGQLKAGEEKNVAIKFDASNIERYNVELIEEKPDESGVIRLLGFELDLSKYGIDLSNVFGFDLSGLNWETIKNGGLSAWNFALDFASSIPRWAYMIASGIVLWHLPAGYLFFL